MGFWIYAFGGCQKFENFQNFQYLLILQTFLKFHKLWTATKGAQIIALIEVRGVLKTSCHWLFNGVKQNNPKVIFDCRIMALSRQVLLILGRFLV